MELYMDMYLFLFNQVTETITLLNEEKYHMALKKLITAQQEAEELFISAGHNEEE